LRFGLAYDFRNPAQWALPWRDLYAGTLDQMVFAEQLGFDSIWIGEQHLAEDGALPSPLSIAAAIAARTSRIRIGVCVPALPLHNAVSLAEQIAVLDQLSGGRIELGLGDDGFAAEFAAFGVPRRQRAARFREAVQVLRLLFSGERISFKGRFYDLDGLTLAPPPLQAGGPPLWGGAISAKQALRAAALRLHLLPRGDRRATLDIWARALGRFGHDPEAFRVLVNRPVVVTDDPLRMWQRLRPGEEYRASLDARRTEEAGVPRGSPVQTDDSQALPLLDGQYLLGSAARVRDEIDAYRERVPVTDLVGWGVPLGLRPDEMYPSLERFAREVMPRFL